MKSISKVLLTSLALALGLVSAASAQAMRVSVPFGFQAGGKQLPAGVYNVELKRMNNKVVLSQLRGYANCMLPIKAFAGPGTPQNRSLVFNQYGSSYFLTHVNVAETDKGVELFTSRAEFEVAKAQPKVMPAMILASGR